MLHALVTQQNSRIPMDSLAQRITTLETTQSELLQTLKNEESTIQLSPRDAMRSEILQILGQVILEKYSGRRSLSTELSEAGLATDISIPGYFDPSVRIHSFNLFLLAQVIFLNSKWI